MLSQSFLLQVSTQPGEHITDNDSAESASDRESSQTSKAERGTTSQAASSQGDGSNKPTAGTNAHNPKATTSDPKRRRLSDVVMGNKASASNEKHCEESQAQHEQEEHQEDDQEADSLSEQSDDSTATDIFHAAVDPHKTWTTVEEQRSKAAQQLAGQLRSKPLLPLHPDDATGTQPWLDTTSGVKLPVAHCAFAGCRWSVSQSSTRPELMLAEHLEK